MSNEELQRIVSEVISSLRTNSVKITDLPEVSSLPSGSYIEISGGRKIKAEKIQGQISPETINEVVAAAVSEAMQGYEGGGGGEGTTTPSTPSEIDYSDSLIDGNWYFNAETLKPTESGGSYKMTTLIPVEPGDTVIITGHRSQHIPFIVGYDASGNSPRELLGDQLLGGGTDYSNYIVNNYERVIPTGVYFIQCAARGEGRDGAPKMVVKVRKPVSGTTIVQQTTAIELARTVFVPEGKKIMILGASFAGPNNGWDKVLQDITGVEVINRAAGGSHIWDNVAARMLDASSSKPHGSLFWVNGKDVFNQIGAVIIMQTHDEDVLLNEELYSSRDVNWYKNNPSETGTGKYQGAWDYVLKQLREWSSENVNRQDSMTKSGVTLSRDNNCVNNQLQLLICSHWLPSRENYNDSSRKLAERHGVAYCPIDTNLGFTKDDKIYDTIQYDGNNGIPKAGYYNRSVLHSQFVGIAANGSRLVGRTETIGGIIWGWHPQTLSSTINYGYGTITAWDGSEKYVPWIQLAIAAIVSSCIEKKTVLVVAAEQEDNEPKDGDYSTYYKEGEEGYYFNAEPPHKPVPSPNYVMTDYIEVKQGDVIVFSGHNNGPSSVTGHYIPYIVGYSDKTGKGPGENNYPVVLLEGNNTVARDVKITIENAGVNYIRCCARKAGYYNAEPMKVQLYSASTPIPTGSEFFVSGSGMKSLARKNTGSTAKGFSSVAIGEKSTAECEYAFAEGFKTYAFGMCSHAEGDETQALGYNSHSEGSCSIAKGGSSHAEGGATKAVGNGSHAEGSGTNAKGDCSHAEGCWAKAEGDGSHAEGILTRATGDGSHAEGRGYEGTSDATDVYVTADGEASHAEGMVTKAVGHSSHAEGNTTRAYGDYSHSEGYNTKAGVNDGDPSNIRACHAEGWSSKATGKVSHAEGNATTASGENSHSENRETEAKGRFSHAGGFKSVADGMGAFAHGRYLQTKNKGEAAFGNYNNSTSGGAEADTVWSVGIGTGEDDRRNGIELKSNGDIYIYLNGVRFKLQDLLTVPGTLPGNYGYKQNNVVFDTTEEEQSDCDVMVSPYDNAYGYYDSIGNMDDSEVVVVDISLQANGNTLNPYDMVYAIDEDSIQGDLYMLLSTIWNEKKLPILNAHLEAQDIVLSIPLYKGTNKSFYGKDSIDGFDIDITVKPSQTDSTIRVSQSGNYNEYNGNIGTFDSNVFDVVDLGTQTHFTGDVQYSGQYNVDEYNLTSANGLYGLLNSILQNNKVPLLTALLTSHNSVITIPLYKQGGIFVGNDTQDGYNIQVVITQNQLGRIIYVEHAEIDDIPEEEDDDISLQNMDLLGEEETVQNVDFDDDDSDGFDSDFE